MRGREGVQKVDYISLWQLNRERTSRGRAAKEAGGKRKHEEVRGGGEEGAVGRGRRIASERQLDVEALLAY